MFFLLHYFLYYKDDSNLYSIPKICFNYFPEVKKNWVPKTPLLWVNLHLFHVCFVKSLEELENEDLSLIPVYVNIIWWSFMTNKAEILGSKITSLFFLYSNIYYTSKNTS